MKCYVIGILFLFACSAWAEDEAYKKGKAAFQQQNYKEAAAYFKQSISAGNRSSGVKYNLAISFFKTGDVKRANKLLREMMASGHYSGKVIYSLAVTEKYMGNTEKAIQLFQAAAQSDTNLAVSANKQLHLLGEKMSRENDLAARSEAVKNIYANMSLARGYNDAVVVRGSNEVTGNGDGFWETMGAVFWRDFTGGKNSGWSLNGFILGNKYDQVDAQNYRMISAGIAKEYDRQWGQWFGGVDFDSSWLGGEGYLRGVSLYGGLKKNISDHNLQFKYRFKQASSQGSRYSAYEGDSSRLTLRYDLKPMGTHRVGFRAMMEVIDRPVTLSAFPVINEVIVYTPTGPQSEYEIVYRDYDQDLSVARNRLLVSWTNQLADGLRLFMDAELGGAGYSSYRQGDLDGTLREGRNDRWFGFSVSAEKKLKKTLKLLAKVRYKSNDSNVDSSDYEQAVFDVGVHWNY